MMVMKNKKIKKIVDTTIFNTLNLSTSYFLNFAEKINYTVSDILIMILLPAVIRSAWREYNYHDCIFYIFCLTCEICN